MIARLGEIRSTLEPVKYHAGSINIDPLLTKPSTKELVGVDVFLDWDTAQRDPNTLGKALAQVAPTPFSLKMITNRGVKVYPDGLPETFCTDHWRCRFSRQMAARWLSATGA